jgi:hypothetical protein
MALKAGCADMETIAVDEMFLVVAVCWSIGKSAAGRDLAEAHFS